MDLVRFVEQPQDWKKALVARDLGKADLPLFALRSFTPSPRENERISLFRISDPQVLASVHAAFWLTQKTDALIAIAIDEEELNKAGLKLEDIDGATPHLEANPLHVDLIVSSGDHAITAAKLFFQYGRLLPVEPKELHARIAEDTGRGVIDYPGMGGKKDGNAERGKLCLVVGKQTVVVAQPAGEEAAAVA